MRPCGEHTGDTLSGSKRQRTSPIRSEAASDPRPFAFNLPAESSTRGVIVTDAEHRIRFTDSRICSLLSIDPSELLGKDVGEVVRTTLKHRFSDPADYERRSEWLRENPLGTAEDVMELVAPEPRILHRYSTPLVDENHQPVGRIEVYSDITRRRQLEEANAVLYSEARAAYEELKAAQDQLVQSEKLRAIGEIASGVAHDFNNTLGIILGNVQLLLRTVKDPKLHSRLRAMEQAALDGAETVRRIREFTRIQPDEPLISIDLSGLAAEVADVMMPSWQGSMQTRDRQIALELDLADDVFGPGIAAEIREVLANVLLNAVQAMPDGGTVRISTGRSEASAWVRIADTGIGMAADVRKRVFDPFFTTRGVEGMGLGMSVAYGIVKRHNGKITVDSIPGEGTTVTISLPAAPEGPKEKVAGRPVEPPAALPARILVVDDEEMFAQVFVEMLSECGHAVAVARSGADAIEQFKAAPFDLVFTDLGMPEMSGWQVARSIKDLAPTTPVVLLTGWGTKVDEDRLAESQVDIVLAKPVRMEELSAIVSTVLAGHRPVSQR